MAVDMFLKLDKILGESTAAGHQGEIEVLSFSWGVTNDLTFGTGGGGGVGKASFHDLSFTHKVDKTSPLLAFACANGQHITSGQLTVTTTGQNPLPYLKILMSDLLVSSYQSGGHASGVPTGEFTLNFYKVQFSVAPINRAGGLGTPVSRSFTNLEHPLPGA